MYHPDIEGFRKLCLKGNLIPIYRDLCADTETPVSAFKKIDRHFSSFLLESVVGGERIARYSFLGANPVKIFQEGGDGFGLQDNNNIKDAKISLKDLHPDKKPGSTGINPLFVLRDIMSGYRPVTVEGLPRFIGGAVGYINYDMVRYAESIPEKTPDLLKLPECLFFITDTLLIFDHMTNRIKVLSHAYLDDEKGASGKKAIDRAYENAVIRIEKIIDDLKNPLPCLSHLETPVSGPLPLKSNFEPDAFMSAVNRTKEYITAGDIIQAVISQRFSVTINCDPFDIYRALRLINPSPYMFYLKHNGLQIIGSSPELMVRVEDGQVEERPIAGTRKRGATQEEDRRLAEELLADPKERAEHIMLVDLARNDIGRVCEYGSVSCPELMTIERYSHVMHIVSQVTGRLRKDKDPYDCLIACFPAGTVSGAPKVRAMEIIEETEPSRRGPYAGAVGYFSFSGNMDTCITIRTIVVKDGQAHVQAGAGIVADSDPEKEYQETLNKAGALMDAIRLAEGGKETRK
ncbi:anthranilate synthase component I [bacterium]|nr:anthranilate synthase component I [bacterium]